MNIVILNPPYMDKFSRFQRSPAVTKSGTIYYPFWLAYATGVLEKEGHNVILIDAPASCEKEENVYRKIKDFSPKLIVVETSTVSIMNDLEVCRNLKEQNPFTFILLVGPHVSAVPEETLQMGSAIDFVAREEYDYTVKDLSETLENNEDSSKVKGISFRKGNKIIHNPLREPIQNLDELPFVSAVYKKHLNIYNYFFAASRYPEVQIFTSRGCPFKCTWCMWPHTFTGRRMRYRSPKNVVDEFQYIKEELPFVKEIVIEDDTFTIDKHRVREICELILDRRLKIVWNANARASLDYKTMRLMKKAGCRLLIAGFESGNQKILNFMKKGITTKQSEQFMRNTRRAKLLVHGCFVLGNALETKKTIKETISFAAKLNPTTAQFFPMMVYPGTESYRWAMEKGYLNGKTYKDWSPDGMHSSIIDTPYLKAKEVVKYCNFARKKYYIRFGYIFPRLLEAIFIKEERERLIKAFKTFYKYLFKSNSKK